MTETSRFVAFSPALAWLVEHPEVAVAARQAASRPGEAFADAVLADPARLVDLHRAAVIVPLEPGTPPGVTEELTRIFQYVAARAAEPTAARQALVPVVASLKGRDRHELVSALRSGADKITDLPTRERVLGLAEYVSHEPTVKKRGTHGQVVVDLVTPTEPNPDPGTPVGPVRPKPAPGKGPGEPVAPVIVDGTPEVGLLDQVATLGGEASVEWAEESGYSPDDAAPYGERYATELALEIMYGSDIGEGSVGATRCLLAEVLGRVGDALDGVHGHASGWFSERRHATRPPRTGSTRRS